MSSYVSLNHASKITTTLANSYFYSLLYISIYIASFLCVCATRADFIISRYAVLSCPVCSTSNFSKVKKRKEKKKLWRVWRVFVGYNL